MNNFTQDWKHRDTSEKINKFEMYFYCASFSISFYALIYWILL